MGKLIYLLFANFLCCISANNYENGLTYVKVMSEDKVDLYGGHNVGFSCKFLFLFRLVN